MLKRKLIPLIAAISLIGLPIAASADTQVNVNANVKQIPAALSLNFDALHFDGSVGQQQVNGVTTSAGAEVPYPTITYTSASSFSLGISTSRPTTTDGKAMDPTRIQFNGYFSTKRLSTENQIITSGTGDGNPQELPVSFTLDLTNKNNSYSDNSVLSSLTGDTNNFQSTITVSFITGI